MTVNIGKFQTQKSLLGIRLCAITYLLIERARCRAQINVIKFLGNPAGKMFERQTKATLEVKTRHFVTTFEGWFAASFFMILSKIVAPWGVPLI